MEEYFRNVSIIQSEISSTPTSSSVSSHQLLGKNIPKINLLSKDKDRNPLSVPNFYSKSRKRSCCYQMSRDRTFFMETKFSIDQESQVLTFQFEN